MESKSTHMWSSCFYIFRTDACTWSKVPQFQNWFSPVLWISPTIFPPQLFKTRHWKTEKVHRVNWYSFGCLWFFRKGQWTTLAKEALRLNTGESNSTKGLLKKHTKQRWKKCIMEFLLTSHMWACPTNFFLLKIECNSLGVQIFNQTWLRSFY